MSPGRYVPIGAAIRHPKSGPYHPALLPSLPAGPATGLVRRRCQIVRASGSFGRIYRARQLTVDRDVAVKVIRGGVDPFSEDGRLFVHEIQRSPASASWCRPRGARRDRRSSGPSREGGLPEGTRTSGLPNLVPVFRAVFPVRVFPYGFPPRTGLPLRRLASESGRCTSLLR
jgi:serine/threonine protein kinase